METTKSQEELGELQWINKLAEANLPQSQVGLLRTYEATHPGEIVEIGKQYLKTMAIFKSDRRAEIEPFRKNIAMIADIAQSPKDMAKFGGVYPQVNGSQAKDQDVYCRSVFGALSEAAQRVQDGKSKKLFKSQADKEKDEKLEGEYKDFASRLTSFPYIEFCVIADKYKRVFETDAKIGSNGHSYMPMMSAEREILAEFVELKTKYNVHFLQDSGLEERIVQAYKQFDKDKQEIFDATANKYGFESREFDWAKKYFYAKYVPEDSMELLEGKRIPTADKVAKDYENAKVEAAKYRKESALENANEEISQCEKLLASAKENLNANASAEFVFKLQVEFITRMSMLLGVLQRYMRDLDLDVKNKIVNVGNELKATIKQCSEISAKKMGNTEALSEEEAYASPYGSGAQSLDVEFIVDRFTKFSKMAEGDLAGSPTADDLDSIKSISKGLIQKIQELVTKYNTKLSYTARALLKEYTSKCNGYIEKCDKLQAPSKTSERKESGQAQKESETAEPTKQPENEEEARKTNGKKGEQFGE